MCQGLYSSVMSDKPFWYQAGVGVLVALALVLAVIVVFHLPRASSPPFRGGSFSCDIDASTYCD